MAIFLSTHYPQLEVSLRGHLTSCRCTLQTDDSPFFFSGLVFEDVLAVCEVVNCSSVEVQCSKACPTIAVDNCNGCQVGAWASWGGVPAQAVCVSRRMAGRSQTPTLGAGAEEAPARSFAHTITFHFCHPLTPRFRNNAQLAASTSGFN